MIPGSNLLALALTVIAPQDFTYFVNTGRDTNSIGLDITTYAAPVPMTGSVQPIPRSLYMNYGLDFQKNYNVFFIQQNVLDIARDISGDRIIFDGKTFQVLSKTDWFAQDGWDAVLTVQVQNVPVPTGLTPPDNGNYETGDSLDFVVPYSLAVVTSGTPRVTITIGENTRYANYLSGSGTQSLTFRYMVVAEDSAPDGISMAALIDLNGGSILSVATPQVPASAGLTTADLTGITINV